MSLRGDQDAGRIEELLGRYVERRLRDGSALDPEELCRESPELVEPLREHIREYERTSRLLAPPEALAPGRVLLHYRIVDQLGAGGMGQVFAAEDAKLGRRVALKVLPPAMASDPERLERFRREARVVAGLNHPNIVTLYSVEEAGGIHFLTMELVMGKTLDALIPAGGLEPEGILRIAEQLVDALVAAHDQGIIHRDLKPANVMVGADGRLRVLDFGLAKLRASPASGGDAVDPERTLTAHHLTGAGRILGTVPYMSPEQVQGRAIDLRTDIFSFGIVLYEMSTGRRPFQGRTSAEVLGAILRDAPCPVTVLRKDLPAHLGQITARCLEKDPERRYPTVHELRDDLDELKRVVDSRAAMTTALARVANLPVERHTVGREQERADLRAGLEAVAAGHGLLMCVAGEPGIGKTTLVEDFLSEVNVTGPRCMVARGRCSERLAGTEAYLPFLEVLDDLLRHPADASVARMMRQAAPWWYAQVAPLAADDPSDVRLTEGVRSTTQERMKRELFAFLRELSHRQPIVFFFDDLHWSDVSTVDLLTYLASRFDTLRLLIVGTYRPEELLLADHVFLKIRPDLQARGVCREIAMGFLSGEEIGAYLALEFPEHDFSPDFSALIHSETEGSPLFMVDLVRDLRNREVIVEEGGRWQLSQSIPEIRLDFPASVHSMIERKIGHLSEGNRRLLRTAGVQGYAFDTAVLGRVLEMGAEEVEERLLVLDRDHGFVRFLEEGEFPDRTLTLRYRFVHALYQNELCASLTRTKLARLSKAVAEALLGYYGDECGPVAAELAALFESARDFARATSFLALAAQNALKFFAHQETVVLTTRGLRLLETLPETPDRAQWELELQIALGLALMSTKGYACPELEESNRRKRELIQILGETPQLFPALWSVYTFYFIKGDLRSALPEARQLLSLARRGEDSALLLLGNHAVALSQFYRGELGAAKELLEEVLALYDPRQHGPLAYLYGAGDIKVNALVHYAIDLWCLGYPDRALDRVREAVALSEELSQPYSLSHALLYVAVVCQYRREPQVVLRYAEEGIRLDTEHGFSHWLAVEILLRGWALSAEGQGEEGIVQLQQGLDAWQATGATLALPYCLSLLADACGREGQAERGLSVLDQALSRIDENDEHYWEAEVYRLKGELLLVQGESEAKAEGFFDRSLEVARRRQAKSLELRTAVSLSRLWQRQGKREDARQMLADIFAWFTEGFDTADLHEAKALLEELSSDRP